jgi:hypothetical protein
MGGVPKAQQVSVLDTLVCGIEQGFEDGFDRRRQGARVPPVGDGVFNNAGGFSESGVGPRIARRFPRPRPHPQQHIQPLGEGDSFRLRFALWLS